MITSHSTFGRGQVAFKPTLCESSNGLHAGCPASRHRETGLLPYFTAFFRNPLDGTGDGSAIHPGPPRSPEYQDHADLHSREYPGHFETAEPAGQPAWPEAGVGRRGEGEGAP